MLFDDPNGFNSNGGSGFTKPGGNGFMGGPRGGGTPIEPKRVGPGSGPNPMQRDWNGWQEGAGPEGNPFGGAGGPMPIPQSGPNWRGNTPPGTGGFHPGGEPLGNAGGPMPRPWPAGSSPVPGNPNAYYMQNHPNNPNSKYAQWKASQQQTPPMPGNTGIVPPHLGGFGGRQDGNGGPRILGGPFGPPHPQGGPQIPQMAGSNLFQQGGLPQNLDPRVLAYLKSIG